MDVAVRVWGATMLVYCALKLWDIAMTVKNCHRMLRSGELLGAAVAFVIYLCIAGFALFVMRRGFIW